MTIDEIMRRIVRAHLNLILACVLLPLIVVILVELRTPPTYVAQVRVQTLSTAPGSSTEADGLSSRLLALATTPEVVREALQDAHQSATAEAALNTSLHRITVERLGESPVVVLSVQGKDEVATARLTSALTGRVVRFMNQGSRDDFERTLAKVKAEEAAALRRRDRLQADLVDTDGLQARDNLQVMLTAAQNDLEAIQNEEASLVLSDVSRDQVTPIDADHPTVDRMSSALLPRSALALLLGLLTGLALAVAQETLRPRIAGIRVLARAMDAPILGSTSQRGASLASAMSLAARRQGVETVVLVGVDDRDQRTVAQLLDGMQSGWKEELSASPTLTRSRVPAFWRTSAGDDLGGSGLPGGAHVANGAAARPAGGPAEVAGVGASALLSSQVRFTDRYGVTPAEEPTAGVIVVSAGTARRTSLEHVQDLVRAMRWPVVGVVEVTPRRGWLVSR
jgi:capsular polysaccharide biosynthesis protein